MSGVLNSIETWLIPVWGFFLFQPLRLILLFVVPLWWLSFWKQIYPTRKVLVWFLVPFVLSLLTISRPAIVDVVWIVNGLIGLIVMFDLLRLPRRRVLAVTRQVERVTSLGQSQLVSLRFTNRSRQDYLLEAKDDWPGPFEPTPQRFRLNLKGLTESLLHYRFTATERGRFEMNCVHLKVVSRWKFWCRVIRIPAFNEIHVYPDLKQISEFELLARANRLNLMGLRRSRRVGQDHDFERLRDYTRDDNHRHIDWRSTARRQKLTVKEFQSNQDQQVVFMIDCGRMMTGQSGKFSMLDHALNAMLLLAYIALRQNDSVGLILFADGVRRFVPPKSGVKHVNNLLHAVFDQRAEHVESRFDEAFLHLRRHCRKRSLVVVITNLIDEINAAQLSNYASCTTRQHLPLTVLLRDEELFGPLNRVLATSPFENETVEQPAQMIAGGARAQPTLRLSPFAQQVAPSPISATDFCIAGAAAEIAVWRHQVLSRLAQQGVRTMDVYPDELTAKLVNEYLEIKARHLL